MILFKARASLIDTDPRRLTIRPISTARIWKTNATDGAVRPFSLSLVIANVAEKRSEVVLVVRGIIITTPFCSDRITPGRNPAYS